jgi:hypothetical protein
VTQAKTSRAAIAKVNKKCFGGSYSHSIWGTNWNAVEIKQKMKKSILSILSMMVLLCGCDISSETPASQWAKVQAAFPKGEVKALPVRNSLYPMWIVRNPDGAVYCASFWNEAVLQTNLMFRETFRFETYEKQ